MKNEGVCGSPKAQFGPHENLSWDVGGRGVQGTLNYLLIHGKIAFTMHLASNKCPYVYILRHPFAGNLSLYRQGCRNSAHSAYSFPNRTAWSPTGKAHPAASHAHCVIQI